jgi:predicted ester cyclase
MALLCLEQGGMSMSPEENKALVRRLVEEVQNRGNMTAIDEIVADTFVKTPLWPNPRRPSSMTTADAPAGVRAGVAMMRTALLDLTTTIDAMTAEGNTVMICTTTRGTHTGGPFFDLPPRGQPVEWTTFAIYRIAGGKIVEQRWLWDRLGAFQQLGVLPSQDELRQKMQEATT